MASNTEGISITVKKQLLVKIETLCLELDINRSQFFEKASKFYIKEQHDYNYKKILKKHS